MTRAWFITATLALSCLASAARAERSGPDSDHRSESVIAVGASAEWPRGGDLGYFWDDGPLLRYGLSLGHDFALGSLVRLGIEAGWSAAYLGRDNLLEGELSSRIVEHRPFAGFALRLQVAPWFLPHLRIAGGPLFGSVELRFDDNGTGASESVWRTSTLGFFGQLGVGFTLRTASSAASPTLGLRVEVAYGREQEGAARLLPSEAKGGDGVTSRFELSRWSVVGVAAMVIGF